MTATNTTATTADERLIAFCARRDELVADGIRRDHAVKIARRECFAAAL